MGLTEQSGLCMFGRLYTCICNGYSNLYWSQTVLELVRNVSCPVRSSHNLSHLLLQLCGGVALQFLVSPFIIHGVHLVFIHGSVHVALPLSAGIITIRESSRRLLREAHCRGVEAKFK